MEVILRQSVDQLGQPGDIVKVSAGYARNFLLPRGLAYEATPGNRKRIAQEKARLDFLAAQASAKKGDERARERLLQKLLELQATTTLIQSLVNEYHLEAMIADAPTVEAEAFAPGRGR